MALIAILGQVVMYFVKAPKEPNNGHHKQVEINTENIASLETDMRACVRVESIRPLEADMRDVQRRLGTTEEQVKNNVLEILHIRPKIHELGKDVGHLLYVEAERKREQDRKQ